MTEADHVVLRVPKECAALARALARVVACHLDDVVNSGESRKVELLESNAPAAKLCNDRGDVTTMKASWVKDPSLEPWDPKRQTAPDARRYIRPPSRSSVGDNPSMS
jgi:hypothetical protein